MSAPDRGGGEVLNDRQHLYPRMYAFRPTSSWPAFVPGHPRLSCLSPRLIPWTPGHDEQRGCRNGHLLPTTAAALLSPARAKSVETNDAPRLHSDQSDNHRANALISGFTAEPHFRINRGSARRRTGAVVRAAITISSVDSVNASSIRARDRWQNQAASLMALIHAPRRIAAEIPPASSSLRSSAPSLAATTTATKHMVQRVCAVRHGPEAAPRR